MCKHLCLHFADGGLHVVCADCNAAWQAVNEQRLVPRFEARGEGLTEQDVRTDPFTAYRPKAK